MYRNAMKASDNLVHYFKTAFEASGLRWDSDNEAEVREIVENLVTEIIEIANDKICSHENSSYHAE